MRSRKKILVILLLLAVSISAFITYNYMYQDHRDIAAEAVDYQLKAKQLSNAMSIEKTALEYTDKVIQTSGIITAIEKNSVVLDQTVQVNFLESKPHGLALDNKVVVKGRCVGYDDLLELVKIDQATILQQ